MLFRKNVYLIIIKRVPIDWIFGSQIVNILVDPKGSKMATIMLPKYYPLSGTSRIQIMKISGHEDSEVKKYQVILFI
jgi:hypothetical protein